MNLKRSFLIPLNFRGNGMVKNFMISINKLVKTACVIGKSWKQQLFKFLRNFGATPHPTTGVSPVSRKTSSFEIA